MLQNVQNWQITECLNFLETKGVSDSQILEKMNIVQSTLNRWWQKNSCTPRFLAKMRIWCAEWIPITDTYVGRRPPEYLFIEALDEAVKTGERKYTRCAHEMHYKGFYEQGIPPVQSRGRMTTYRSLVHKKRPDTEFVIETIAKFHPNPIYRETFSILSNENRQVSEEV